MIRAKRPAFQSVTWLPLVAITALMASTLLAGVLVTPTYAQSTVQTQSTIMAAEGYDLGVEAWLTVKSRCGGCHLPQIAKPAAPPIHAIASPAALANSAALVRPGQPDQSALVWRMLDRHAVSRADPKSRQVLKSRQVSRPRKPPDKTRSQRPPAMAGLAIVRNWIARLPVSSKEARPGPGDVLSKVGDGPGRLQIEATQPTYRLGEAMAFRVRVSGSCRLNLINIDASGSATVMYPNAFSRDNDVAGNTAMRLPGKDAPFVFKARRQGQETLIAICAGRHGALFGLRHDFIRQRFTVLGDWERFLTTGKPPRAYVPARARRRWRYRRVRRCRRYKRRGRRVVRCRWRRRRAGLIKVSPPAPLPRAALEAVAVVTVKVR